MSEPMRKAPAVASGNGMTTEELEAIATAMRALTVDDSARPAGTRQVAAARWAFATSAVRRFNFELEAQRRLLETARAQHAAGERVPDEVQVELRAAAVLYRAERDRIVRCFGLRVVTGSRPSLAV